MAFNSFDKLCKAQRDYPKPKFATAVVDKALKKQPNNPYLLVKFFCTEMYFLVLMLATDMESRSCAPTKLRKCKR
jgi:hypothetical protein